MACVPPGIVVRPNPFYYFIRSRLNEYVLSLQGGRCGDGAHVVLSPKVSPTPLKRGDHSSDCQLWHFEDAGDGCVYVVSKSDVQGRQVLDIEGAKTSKGANLITYHRKYESEGTVANQKFRIRDDGSISSVLNGMVLDVKGGKGDPGTQVITYPQKAGGAANQRWCLEPAYAGRHHQHHRPPAGAYPPQPRVDVHVHQH